MTDIELQIVKEMAFFEEHFGDRDCFKLWVDNINYGEKFVVYCRFRQTEFGRRVTRKYHTTIKNN